MYMRDVCVYKDVCVYEGHLWRQRKLKVRCPAVMLASLRIRRVCTDSMRLKTWEGDMGRGHSDARRLHQCCRPRKNMNLPLCFEKPPFVFYRADHCLKLIKLNEGT